MDGVELTLGNHFSNINSTNNHFAKDCYYILLVHRDF